MILDFSKHLLFTSLTLWCVFTVIPVEALAQPAVPFRQIGAIRVDFEQPKWTEEQFKEYCGAVRGLIQNELDVVASVCKPDADASKQLVDLAEKDWILQTQRHCGKKYQPHVHGTVDWDGIVEQAMVTWVCQTLPNDQSVLYSEEIQDRMFYRKQAVISQTLLWMQGKLQLSDAQLEQVRTVLEEKWKDRWYRSFEGAFENETLLPEINRSWVDHILTSAQRSALSTRTPYLQPQQTTPEYPTLPSNVRFKLGEVEAQEPEMLMFDIPIPRNQLLPMRP